MRIYIRADMIECIGLTGSEAIPYIKDLAALRCSVFREYPYLYDGDELAESAYLANYSKSDDVFLVIARAGDRVVGVSTCMAMSHADQAFRLPFENFSIPIEQMCYFGESVLLPEYRGMGVGHRFFDLREKWSAERGFVRNVFCAVMRPEDHPKKQDGYRSHDSFWEKRGYRRLDGVIAELTWKEVDDPSSEGSEHRLVFWMNG